MFDGKIYVFSCVRVKEPSCSTSLSFRFNKQKKNKKTIRLLNLGIVKGEKSFQQQEYGKGFDPGWEEAAHNDGSPRETLRNAEQAKTGERDKKQMSLCCGGGRDRGISFVVMEEGLIAVDTVLFRGEM